MKTQIWIFLLFLGLSIITVTSDNSATNRTLISTVFPDSESNTKQLATTASSSHYSTLSMQTFLSTMHATSPPFQLANKVNYQPKKYAVSKQQLGDSSKYKRAIMFNSSTSAICEGFSSGHTESQFLYSPGYSGNYPNKSDCVAVLEAPLGFLLRLDFRDHFDIEPSEDCKFDYLEIRDGAFGYSSLKGKYCGHDFPPMVHSKDRFLWLHFHSDENIEYKGFVLVYEFIPRPTSTVYDDTSCRFEYSGAEGGIGASNVSASKMEMVREHNLPLDCMWTITAKPGFKIQLSFATFKLSKPNDCDSNFVDVFENRTDIPSRLKNFCGSIADLVVSRSNIVFIRYYVEPSAINSTFSILFTAFREKVPGGSCDADEYDCEDTTCIAKELYCNGYVNCRFTWDEATCKKTAETLSDHVIIIVIVFSLILGCMMVLFFVNCMRKIIRDHKIIREHIRQSRESKLDELGRHSTKLTKSRENLAMATLTKIPPPSFENDSPSSVNLIENNQHYYREQQMPSNGAKILDSKNDLSLREQEIKHILNSTYGIDDDDQQRDAEVCDMACQTRESLFQPVFKNKVTQSPCPIPGGIRFSTFGYDSTTPSPPPPPLSQIPTAHNIPLGSCPTHNQKTGTLPHQKGHMHHHHYHHVHNSGLPKKPEMKTATTTIEMEDFDSTEDEKHKKYIIKKDETQQRSFSDIRKSAPDVIIMTSSH